MREKAFVLFQLTVIVAMSAAAGYAFQHTQTVYEFNGLCIYRYIAYFATVFLGYLCFSSYKKVVGLAFSLTLAVLALSPIGPIVIELFPLFAPLVAVLMGAISFLVFPDSRKRGFLEFLLVLIFHRLVFPRLSVPVFHRRFLRPEAREARAEAAEQGEVLEAAAEVAVEERAKYSIMFRF